MKYDDNLFEDTPYPTTQQMDDSLFEDSNTPSELESLARGGAQGLTFSLADELTGAGEALGRATFGEDSYKDLLKNYQKYRDESRTAYKAAEEANPASYLTGEISGSIAPAFMTGGASAVANLGKVGAQQGIKQLGLAGLKQGAVAGLGASEADLLEGELAQATKDTAIGGIVGGAAGVTLPVVANKLGQVGKSVANKISDKSPAVFEKGKQAYDLAKKGISSVGKEAREKLQTDATAIAKTLIDDFRQQYKKGSEKVGESLKSKTSGIDFSKQLGELEQALQNSSILPDDLAKIQKELNNYKDIVTTETVEPGLEKALNKMQNLIDKAQSASSALGEDISFSPIENVNNKFLQSLKTKRVGEEVIGNTPSIQEGSGLEKASQMMQQKSASLQAQAKQLGEQISITPPVFDKESNSLISVVKGFNNKGEEISKTITQKLPKDTITNIPNFEDKLLSNVLQVDIPEDTIVKNTVENFKTLGLEDLNNVKAELGSMLNKASLDNKTKSVISKLKSEVDDMIINSMDQANQNLYRQGNEEIKQVYQAGDILKELSPSSRFDSDLDLSLSKKLLSPSKTNEVERAMGYGSNLQNISKEAVKDLPIRQQLQTDLKGEGGLLGGLINPKGAAIRIGEAAGNVANKMEPVADFTKRMVKLDDTVLASVANKMKMSNEEAVKKFGTTLERAIQDTSKRDRLIWALSQQPEFRRIFNESNQEQQN